MKRRKGLNKVSPRAEAYRDELDRMRPLVIARAHGLCECCGDVPGTVVHHRKKRSQGGTNGMGNLMLLDSIHHDRIHANPARSYELGFLLHRDDDEGSIQ